MSAGNMCIVQFCSILYSSARRTHGTQRYYVLPRILTESFPNQNECTSNLTLAVEEHLVGLVAASLPVSISGNVISTVQGMHKKHIEISGASSQFADSESLQAEGQPGQLLPLLGLFLSISSKIKNWEMV